MKIERPLCLCCLFFFFLEVHFRIGGFVLLKPYWKEWLHVAKHIWAHLDWIARSETKLLGDWMSVVGRQWPCSGHFVYAVVQQCCKFTYWIWRGFSFRVTTCSKGLWPRQTSRQAALNMVIIPIERSSAPYMSSLACKSVCVCVCIRDRDTQQGGVGQVVYAQDSQHVFLPEVWIICGRSVHSDEL